MLHAHAEQGTQLRDRGRGALRVALDRAGENVGHLRDRVAALSPAATLSRGYAVVQTAAGAVLRDPAEAAPGDLLRLRLAGGELAAAAQGPWPPNARTTSAKGRAKASPGGGPPTVSA
jgi:exodeoxyribonuclease VII large subunit